MNKIDILYLIYDIEDTFYESLFLKSIHHIDGDRFNILVCDTGTKQSRNTILKINKKFKYYYEQSFSFDRSKAINIGVGNLSSEDRILISDLDVLYSDDLYELLNTDKELVKFHFWDEKELYKISNFINNNNKFSQSYIKNFSWPFYFGVAVSFYITRKCFDELGGFDENYSGYGCEDDDFFMKYLINKYPITKDNISTYVKKFNDENPNIWAIHLNGHINNNQIEERNKQREINKKYYMDKWSNYI